MSPVASAAISFSVAGSARRYRGISRSSGSLMGRLDPTYRSGTMCGKKGLTRKESVDSYAGGWKSLVCEEENDNDTYGIHRNEETALAPALEENEREEGYGRSSISVEIHRECVYVAET